MDFYISVFFQEKRKCARVSWVFAHLPAALKEKYANPNLQPIITFFRPYLSSWNTTFWLSFLNNWTSFVFVMGMLRMHMCSFLVVKNARFNWMNIAILRVPHACYLSGLSFITPLELVWWELDMKALNNGKKKCVGLPRTWGSKRTLVLTGVRIPYIPLLIIHWRH